MLDAPQEKYCCSFTSLICQLIVQFKNIVICLMLNKIYCITLYRILDNTIILSMDWLSKIYHILLRPAINYNYYADTIQV